MLSCFAKLIVFSIFGIVIWTIFEFIRPYLIKFITEFTNGEFTVIKKIVSSFLVLLDAVVSKMATSFVSSLLLEKQEIPKVFITSPQKKVQNVSGIKTSHTCASHLCIKLGNKQPKFRIVYAEIKNTGKRIIAECSINKQVLNIILEPGQSSKLYFIVYDSADNTSINHNYKFSYWIRDDQGNIYTGKYCMQVDYNNSKAVFCSSRKIKRSVLKK